MVMSDVTAAIRFHRALGWFWTLLTLFHPKSLSLAGKAELNPHQVTNQA